MALVPPTSVGSGSSVGSGETLLKYELLAGTQATLDLASIVATYAALRIHANLRGTDAAANLLANIRFNNDSGGNYSYQWIQNGGSSSAGSLTASTLGNTVGAGAGAGSSSTYDILIPNYAATTYQRQFTVQGAWWNVGVGTAIQQVIGLWGNTVDPISRVTLLPAAGSWAAGSMWVVLGVATS